MEIKRLRDTKLSYDGIQEHPVSCSAISNHKEICE